MSDKDTRVSHRVPKHIRDAAQNQTEHGELSELVRDLYRRVAHGDASGGLDSVELELQRVRKEKDQLRGQIGELQNELKSLEQEETRLEEKLTNRRSKQDKYEGHLESIEADLRGGMYLDDDNERLKRAGRAVGKPPQAVIEDLKERNPDVPDHAFEQAYKNPDKEWHGVPDE